MPSEEDMAVFYEVFRPTIRNSKGYGGPRWWLHAYAGTSRGTERCWAALEKAGFVSAVPVTNVPYSFDLVLTDLGELAVVDHYPEYKQVYEDNIIQRVERSLGA
jgi:hypothetical protein